MDAATPPPLGDGGPVGPALRPPPIRSARWFGSPAFAPHLLFFGFYNLIYFLPLFLVFLWGYGRGGAADMVAMDAPTMLIVTFIYLVGVAAFALGSLPLSLMRAGRRPGFGSANALLPQIRLSDKLAIVLVAIVFVISKIALIPLGVYQTYAFSTGEMTGGVWTFSTFCSETMVLLGILALFSGSRHNVLMFTAIAALNGINLLHGSRIFFIVTVLAALLYACFRGYLTLRRALLYGPLAGMGVLVLAYVVFLSRSGASVEGAFSAARLVSPVVYESLFSQLSLVSLLRVPELWDATGHVLSFLSDVVVNSAPRVVLPDKDVLVYFSHFDFLSPVGGMNGYAAGLIYFGLFFPFFYFLLGFVASWLHMKALTGPWWFVLYAYFTADFLFRIMRDGYLIPIKMLINTLQLVVLFIAARALFRVVKKSLIAGRGAPRLIAGTPQ